MGRRRSGRAPNVHWTGFNGGANALAAGSIGVQLIGASHGTETLVRTRGNLVAYVDGAQAPGGQAFVAVGMILMPEGTGTTVTVRPHSERDASWFYWTEFNLGYEEMVTDVIDVPGLSSIREVIDSKAMRIMRTQEIQLVVENITAQTAISVNVAVAGRFLTQE